MVRANQARDIYRLWMCVQFVGLFITAISALSLIDFAMIALEDVSSIRTVPWLISSTGLIFGVYLTFTARVRGINL